MIGLAVVDGDLVLAGNDYYALTGANRIKQDLSFALTDEYGVDPYHPYWGSILDRYVGLPLNSEVRSAVIAEVTRVVNNYIAVQSDVINKSSIYGTKSALSTNDVVSKLESVNVSSDYDKLNISVSLRTMSGETVQISRSVTL